MDDQPELPPDTPEEEDDEKWPVGFLFIVIVTALYLIYRLIQGVVWLIHHL